MSQPLFSVPIVPCGNDAGGTITCTEPHPAVYVLTWTSPPENRITTPFLHALLTALDVIEYGDYKRGVVVTTSGIPKYYSNGADLDHAFTTDGFWQLFHDTWARLLTWVKSCPIFVR
jgi:enoyl-CoA hydratase/carnithine racemase